MAKIYKSVEELIGNTPLLELTKIEKETGATLLAKVEALNPGGSAKDRIAKRMVEDAEKAGILKEGATIIEPNHVCGTAEADAGLWSGAGADRGQAGHEGCSGKGGGAGKGNPRFLHCRAVCEPLQSGGAL